jgi:caffeoyl-CoA O-methyltransferase
MFHTITPGMKARMQELEETDARERADNTLRQLRLRQIPPETGKFLALLAANTPEGAMIEIGTSGGYSTLWLSLACEQLDRTLTTFEVSQKKVDIARETIEAAGVEEIVNLVKGDARESLDWFSNIAFCFLDAEKEVYAECYEQVIPNLVRGGLLVADNASSHQVTLQPVIDKALADERIDAMVIPIGKGLLVCRKLG